MVEITTFDGIVLHKIYTKLQSQPKLLLLFFIEMTWYWDAKSVFEGKLGL